MQRHPGKSNDAGVKAHRAKGIATRLMKRGVTRKAANETAVKQVERDYARRTRGTPRKSQVDEDARDATTGRRKVDLRTRRGSQVSGASKIAAAKGTARTKRSADKGVPRTGSGTARRPRASSSTLAPHDPNARKSAAATRRPPPRKPRGAKRRSATAH